MTTEIDPNVRVRGNLTYVMFEDLDRVPTVGSIIDIHVPETSIVGKGTIVSVDYQGLTAYVKVEWGSLRDD